jgi:hypothetical protein
MVDRETVLLWSVAKDYLFVFVNVKADTSNPVLIRIVEAYSNEQKPSDGEIFRKIRLYHRENDQEAEKRWWSRLEKSKPKDLRQLFRRPSLTASFDALIDMPGLWAKLQLGALHRLLVLKCDEVRVYMDKARSFLISIGNDALLRPCRKSVEKNLTLRRHNATFLSC